MKRYRITIAIGSLMFLAGLAIGLCLPAMRASNLQLDSRESEQCQVTQGAVKSTLDNKEECCLCGSNSRSLMGMYRGKDDLGIISLNNWYVLDMGVGKDGDETMSGQNFSRITATGEGGCIFHVDQNHARRISEVRVEYGEENYFDPDKVRGYLCQTCLDKLLDVMDVYGDSECPIGLCMIDFQTQELYSLQEQYVTYYIRDYYVKIESGEEKTVTAVYAPEKNIGFPH
jgi:hypothetical protein